MFVRSQQMNKRRYMVTQPLDLKLNGKTKRLNRGEDLWAFTPLGDPVKVLFEGKFEGEIPLNIFSAAVTGVPAKDDLVGAAGQTGIFKVIAVDHNDSTVDLQLKDGGGPSLKKVPWTVLVSASQNGEIYKPRPRFFNLRVSGFRRLRNVDLSLRPLTILLGANGVGKTSVLDVMSLLAASANGGLNQTISDLSGIGSLLTYDDRDQMSLALSMDTESGPPLEYLLTLVARGLAYEISEERLTQQRKPKGVPFKFIDSHLSNIRYFEVESGKLLRPNWEHNPLESSLSQVPKMFQEPELFRQALASSTLYHQLSVSQRAPIRLPQPMRPAKLPGSNGEDLVPCLYYLRETDHDRFESIEETLRAAFPNFKRLDFPPVAAGTITIAWNDRDFPRPLYAHQLSEGTLRFLWLTTLLHSSALPDVTMIDEPEVSLHPEMLRLLTGLFREASRRTQLIVATHSDRLVRFLKPEELAVMDIGEDGGTSVTWADTRDLESWMQEYTLDDLWRMGRIGGRASA